MKNTSHPENLLVCPLCKPKNEALRTVPGSKIATCDEHGIIYDFNSPDAPENPPTIRIVGLKP